MKTASPSATARLIAAATVLSASDPSTASLIPPAAASWCASFLSFVIADRLLLASVRTAPGRAGWRLVERMTLPGMIRHYALRKAYIETVWRQAKGDGYRQLLVLGAGLDTLGLRVAAADSMVRVVELDHPATQSIKRRALLERAPHNFHMVEGRLDRAGWSPAIREAGALDPALATLVLLEGVSMYLNEAAVIALLGEVGRLPAPRLRLVMTLFDRSEKRRIGFRPTSRLVTGWLRVVGEPFFWGCEDDRVGSFLRSCGFGLIRLAKPRDFTPEARATATSAVLEGEGVAVADHVTSG